MEIMPEIKYWTKEDYDKALKSGMFWEYYPNAKGSYLKDTGENKMKVIDIREMESGNEDVKIKFSKDSRSNACYIEIHPDYHNKLRMVDCDEYGDDAINIRDIPDLIKALEKAYELWK